MSNKWEREWLRNQARKEHFKNNDWEEYKLVVKPIHYDKPSVVIRSGRAKYEKSKSLFGPQKITGQVKINFHPRKKANSVGVRNKLYLKKTKEIREKRLIKSYLCGGYDPRKVYEREEDMYKEAVRVLEPVDLEYGIMKKHDVANRKWTDWRYSTNHKKHTRKVSFEDDPFFFRKKKYLYRIKHQVKEANMYWQQMFRDESIITLKDNDKVWFQDNPFYSRADNCDSK